LLCFLKSKYGKIGTKPLKSSIIDFYKVEDLIAAKRQLIKDADSLYSVQLPHITERSMRYMLSPIRLSSVCLTSVCNARAPYSAG